MAPAETIALVLVGIVVVFMPLVIIGAYAGKLAPAQRTRVLVLYGAGVLLVAVLVADAAGWLPGRLAVDIALLGGGLATGAYAARLLMRP